MTKLLIATDAWGPQINGVVRSLENIAAHAASFDMEVRFLTPSDFWTMPLPGYGEIRLALTNPRKIATNIAHFAPDFVHIATEGPIGLAARRACLHERRPFTTSYHTRFPEYVRARCGVPLAWTYAALRRFHAPSKGVMVATETVRRELAGRGFDHLVTWTRGVDTALFRPGCEPTVDLPRPVFDAERIDRVGTGDVFAEDHELVTRETRDTVPRSQQPGQSFSNRHEQLVADLMAVRVVDLFEVIQIDEHHRRDRLRAATAAKRVVNQLQYQRAIGQPSEGIM